MKHEFILRDALIMNSLIRQPDAEIGYDGMRDCLLWSDERPNNCTNEGYELYQDLVIARAFLFHNLQIEIVAQKEIFIKPEKSTLSRYGIIWTYAKEAIPLWVGLARIRLSPEDIKFFLEYRKHPY